MTVGSAGTAGEGGPVAPTVFGGRPPASDLVLLAVGVAGVSTSAPLIREAAAPSLAIAAWRNLLAAIVLGSLVAAHAPTRRQVLGLTRREAALAGLAGLLLGAHFAVWIPSLSFTTVASSTALVATQPVWAAIVARLRGHAVPAATWGGIAVAMVGMLVVTGVDFRLSTRALGGDLLAVAGGALAAAYVTVGAEVRRTVSTTAYTTVCYTVAALSLLATTAVARQPLTGFSGRTWACIAGLTLGAQLLGHSVFSRVLRTTSPTVVSVAILFEVLGASLLAWAWFGEVPPAGVVPAALLIGAGVVLVVRSGAVRTRGPARPEISTAS